jgi:hypothetical protein
MTTPLTDGEREAFGRLADALIPAGTRGPSASEAGVAGPLLAQALAFLPDLAERLRPVLTRARGTAPAVVLAELRRTDPDAYDGFCETVAAIYFLSPEVRLAVGYPGRVATPARIDAAELENLLMPVLEAGFVPRSAEGGGER